MALQQFRASAQLQAGTRVDVSARQFSLAIDEPAELGGTDTGMNPVEALLGALGACQAIVARVYARQFKVQLDDFRVEVEGDLDLDGFFGKAPVRPGYGEIRYRFQISTPSPRANVDALIAHLERHCPVGDSLAQPVPLKLAGIDITETAAA
ncbi:OsmC family protein [Isoalcanivorax beigongshangi]|uniref:OsmC family protein n=1 Tax=Isoalcanivorax beigongshangi TaxID=3238810 RepID=A0ABV4AHW8_9GAMM